MLMLLPSLHPWVCQLRFVPELPVRVLRFQANAKAPWEEVGLSKQGQGQGQGLGRIPSPPPTASVSMVWMWGVGEDLCDLTAAWLCREQELEQEQEQAQRTALREEGGTCHFNPPSIIRTLRQKDVAAAVFQVHRLEPSHTPSASATSKICGKCSWRCASGGQGRLAPPFQWLEQVLALVLVL